jgi:glycosyltransferase involved in cell wall biosynthesis
MITKGKKPGIIAFVPEAWSAVKMSRHHLLDGLAREYKVLWVAPPGHFIDRMRPGFCASSGRRGLLKRSDDFWCYSPAIPAGYRQGHRRKGVVGWSAAAYTRLWRIGFIWKIKGILADMGVDEVILYIWRPEFGWAVGRLRENCLVYHMVDEYSFDPEKDHPISSEELQLIKAADLVLIHSRSLFSKKGAINNNSHLLPNGVDFEAYRRAIAMNVPEPREMQSIPRPRMGYMGYIKRHLDLELLYELALERPQWSYVLVGPVRENHYEINSIIERLRGLPNVYFVGSVDAANLPAYIKSFDIGLMPYRKTFYTKYIYPLKLHEYLAVGIPVVSTPIENVTEFGEVIAFAETSDQWITAMEKALNEDDEAERSARIAVASQNSWSHRVTVLSRLISSALMKKHPCPSVPYTAAQGIQPGDPHSRTVRQHCPVSKGVQRHPVGHERP